MTGKMSTIIRVIDSAPISTMSNAAIAEVYGLRRAMRTRPIIQTSPETDVIADVGWNFVIPA